MKPDTLTMIELQIMLAIQAIGADSYGVPIREKINEAIGKAPNYGVILTTLERLKKHGYVESRIGEATAVRGGRKKTHWKITGAGIHAITRTQAGLRTLESSIGNPVTIRGEVNVFV